MTGELPVTILQAGDRVQVHTTTVRSAGREVWVNYEVGTVLTTWGADAHTCMVQLDRGDRVPVSSRYLELL